ncbi:MAG: di-heme oxidoredictase family protein [Chitinophagales bacterium]|nr:di-heme oxidoredictase family protein [Chitinophagales bacterium]
MSAKRHYLVFLMLLIVLLVACEKLTPPAPDDNALLDGPLPGLTTQQSKQFLDGDIAFNDEVFTVESGLGPLFVATSCGSCHAGDGKGTPFTTLTRFGQHDATGNQFLQHGGPQLQNRAIPGYVAEQIPSGATFAKFTPPSNTGLGFIELVSDEDIIAMSDPFDANGDGISGVPNWKKIPEYINPRAGALENNENYICRFGKKAGAYNLLQQTVNAYNQDMGITSIYEPIDVASGLEFDPEVTTQTVHNVVFYLQTLKAPIPRDQDDAQVSYGKQIFMNIGCEGCHKQTLKTGASPVEALNFKEFHPYTDLLLHDMGPGLDDGYTEGSALTSEWRTSPLWGLGLSPISQGGLYYLMHDGRAHSIEEAILMHGGEATASREAYNTLTRSDKDALIKFLESL